MKKLVISCTACLILGFFIGLKQKPEKVIVNETTESQVELINSLKSKIKKLTEENVKENVKIVIVEKPDGSKVTTKTKSTERNTVVADAQDSVENTNIVENVKIEKKTTTINHSSHNAAGVRVRFDIPRFSPTYEAYVRAGLKCFIFECYVEGSYNQVNQDVQGFAGLELRF